MALLHGTVRTRAVTLRRVLISAAVLAAAACGDDADPEANAPTSVPADEDASESEAELAECTTAPPPGVEQGTIDTDDGSSRHYAIDMPARREVPSPLIVDLHEFGNTIEGQIEADRWGSIQEDEGVVVLYPEGNELEPGGPTVWYSSVDGDNPVDDAAFVTQLIREVVETACIDPARVHLVGFSMGSGLAALLSCQHPDLVASTVTLTGFIPASDSCDGDAEVPALHVHGDADPVADYTAERVLVESWAAERGCGSETTPTGLADEVTREDFVGCSADLAIVTIAGGGHQRPGDPAMLDPERFGPQSDQVSTAELAWAWFESHPSDTD